MSQYQFKTTNIRGKQYVEVNERIKFFRQDECLCRCTITDKDGMVIAVGHAHENRTASNINKTSYVENCETSAVGRALAMLGIGIDTSIASANEVETAIEQQEEKPAPKKRAAKKAPAKKAAPKKEEPKAEPAPVDDIMDKAVNYIKGASDKRKAYNLIEGKYGDQLTDQQLAGLLKFVR